MKTGFITKRGFLQRRQQARFRLGAALRSADPTANNTAAGRRGRNHRRTTEYTVDAIGASASMTRVGVDAGSNRTERSFAISGSWAEETEVGGESQVQREELPGSGAACLSERQAQITAGDSSYSSAPGTKR